MPNQAGQNLQNFSFSLADSKGSSTTPATALHTTGKVEHMLQTPVSYLSKLSRAQELGMNDSRGRCSLKPAD